MLPKAQNDPAIFLESTRDEVVAPDIVLNLAYPKCSVALDLFLLGLPIVTMPKMAVTKYRDLCMWKCKIWVSKNLGMPCRFQSQFAQKAFHQSLDLRTLISNP